MKKLSEINEGLWAKGFKRSETGEERKEDKSSINDVCKLISETICEYLNIPFDKNVCVCTNIKDNKYTITFNIKNSSFNITIPIEDEEDKSQIMISINSYIDSYIQFSKDNNFKRFRKLLKHVGSTLIGEVKKQLQ